MDIYASTDKAILKAIGAKIRKIRLNMDISQAKLAHDANISISVVQKIERGESYNFPNLIRVLRMLHSLEMLEQFYSEDPISPVAMAKLLKQTHKKQRASKTNTNPLW